jgi:heme exporter protein D
MCLQNFFSWGVWGAFVLLQDGMQIEQHAANWLKSLKTRPPQGLQRFAQRFLEESDKICQVKVDVRLVIPPQLYL